jgi:hypothetical protein
MAALRKITPELNEIKKSLKTIAKTMALKP